MDGSRVMVAFHGDAAVKSKYLARVEAHRKADEIVQGYYWQNGKGCAVGCTVHSSSHAAFETELGIPRVLARLEDQIFEGIDNATAKEWPEQFLSAPAVGADLSMIWPRFALWLLSNPDGPVVLAVAKSAAVKAEVEGVAALYQEWVSTCAKPAKARWTSASAAASASADAAAYAAAYAADAAADAYAAAAYAADAAADAAAAYAVASAYADAASAAASASAYADADAAADAAAYAAVYAADAAAAAAYAARSKFWLSARDKLLELMRDAPVISDGCAT